MRWSLLLLPLLTGCAPYLQGYFDMTSMTIESPAGTFEHEDVGFWEFNFDDSDGFVSLRYDIAIDAEGNVEFVPRTRIETTSIEIESYKAKLDWKVGPFFATWEPVKKSTFRLEYANLEDPGDKFEPLTVQLGENTFIEGDDYSVRFVLER